MTMYNVTYEIDVEADNPEEAALLIEDCMLHPHYRPSFTVKDDKSRVSTTVDLWELERQGVVRKLQEKT